MIDPVRVGNRSVGPGEPCYVIAEIGINHNGSLDAAKQLVSAARLANCQAVKFQKRTPEICVPPAQQSILRETPWGLMTYLEYRHKVEFDASNYQEISNYCREHSMQWFASCWDENSVDFIEQFDPPCYKIASACLTDSNLLRKHRETGKPLIVSTGMSTIPEIDAAVELVGTQDLILMHTNSSYPAPVAELNLRVITTLLERYKVPVGYSGHETGLAPSLVAVALGASIIERHITLDRALWGSDQAASLEPHGFSRLVRDIRVCEQAMGDGEKRVTDSEIQVMKKLRRVIASEIS